MLAISQEPYFHRYPVFWQWFMWFFGGFILTDMEDREYELLSSNTGIPVEHIPSALASYDKVFPKPNGWFFDLGSRCHIRTMHLFPVPFMGIGAYARRCLYVNEKDFDKIPVQGQYTTRDLCKWNNVAYRVLSSTI